VGTASGWPQRWVSAAAAAGPAEVVGFFGAGDRAARRGWTVVGDGAGEHLDVVNDPARVADLIG
jgi:hypothetical protein